MKFSFQFCRKSWITASIVAALLAGCSSQGIVRKPAKLAAIRHALIRPKRVWSHDIGNGSGGLYPAFRIAVAQDGIFVGSEDGEAAAYQPETGKVLWHHHVKGRLIAGPTVNGDEVLFGTLGAHVIALQRSNGALLWRSDAPSVVMAPPVAHDGIVVVRGVNGMIYGLDESNGARVWSFQSSEPRLTLRGQSAPLFVGRQVLIGLDNGKLIALNVRNGKLLWSDTLVVPNGQSELKRLVDIDADLLLSKKGVFAVSYGGVLALVNPSTGAVQWKKHMRSYTGMSVNKSGNAIFLTDVKGYVWALNTTNGAESWVSKALKFRQPSAPVIFNNHVVVGDFKGYLNWFNTVDGKIIGRTRMGDAPIVTPPAVGHGLLFVMNTAGQIAAFKEQSLH